jgi:hypothetical protein
VGGGQGVNIVKVQYTHVQKCHSEIPHFVQLVHANKVTLKIKVNTEIKIIK